MCTSIRFYNNIFVGAEAIPPNKDPNERQKIGYGLDIFNDAERPMQVDGNIYLKGARPYKEESTYIENKTFDPEIKIERKKDSAVLHITLDPSFWQLKNQLVTTQLLGEAVIPEVPFENSDGSALVIDKDYFGKDRDKSNPTAGPFANPGDGRLTLKVR